MPYLSSVTGRQEVLPVSVDFVARRGCHGVLVDLMKALYKEPIVKEVKTGRSLVRGGGVLM